MSEATRSSGTDGPDPSTSRGRGRSVWSYCVYLATTAGLVCAIASWGMAGAAVTMVAVVTVTAILTSAAIGGDGRPAGRRIARFTLAMGLVAPAAFGLIGVFQVAGFLIVLILVATSPAFISLVQKRWRAQEDAPVTGPESATARIPATSPADGPAADPARDLGSLDDEALCLAWRRSFRLLEIAPTVVERLAVVEQRQQYLDELHRRSPEGVAAWLASGARASSNPLPYVDDARRRAT